jgi:hypothetical protein
MAGKSQQAVQGPQARGEAVGSGDGVVRPRVYRVA